MTMNPRIGIFDAVSPTLQQPPTRWQDPPTSWLAVQNQQQAQSADKRAQLMLRRRKWPARIAGLLTGAIVLTGLVLSYNSGWLPSQLRPSRVVVRGADMSSAQEILQVLGCDAGMSLPQLWWRARSLHSESSRWLLSVSMSPRLSRTAVLEVKERRPLVLVRCGQLRAWLCDDNMLVPLDAKADQGGRFVQLRQLPLLDLPAGTLTASAVNPGQAEIQDLPHAPELLSIIAACATQLPLQVGSVKLTEEGRAELVLKDGFLVRLGELRSLPVKLAALPKALRLCEGQRHKLLYLDASDSGIFYQKWKDVPMGGQQQHQADGI